MSIKYNEFVKKPLEEYQYSKNELLELSSCSDNIKIFYKYVKIVHPDKGLITFNPYNFQKKILKTVDLNRFTAILCSRQAGKTVVTSVYALHYAIFNADKYVGIVSNKQTSAIDILSRIKRMYEELPVWIKPGVKEYSKTFIAFDNGTKITVSATSADAFRGRTLNLLIADELAFVRKGIAEDFWAANYPTISTSTEAKIIIISTPNGMFNLFHKLYSGADRKENTFIPLKFTWRDVPGRDKKWADEQLRNLGETKFKQEQEVEFLGSVRTVIDTNILESLYNMTFEPLLTDLDGAFKILEKPELSATYIIGCDVAKGTGEHSSTMQILKVQSVKPVKCKQVAVFDSNKIDVYGFSDIINRTSYYYNNAYIMCENNAEGAAVVNRLWWDFENSNLINSGSKRKDLGIRASRASKPKAVLLMKRLIEDGSIDIFDIETINQLGAFIEKNKKYFGQGYPDDLVSGLYWACYFFEMNILEDGFELRKTKKEDDGWGILSDVDTKEDWSWVTDGSSMVG